MKNLQLFRIQGILISCFFALNLNAQYQLDFESVTKSTYDTDTIVCNNIKWELTDVLIGNSSYDWKNGNASARLRGYGSSCITMVTDKADGAGTLTFQYCRYGTDSQVAWVAEYSTNGGTDWSQLGSEFTALTDGTVSTFSQSLNLSSGVRIRIRKVTNSGTSNKRLNIDDVVLTSYSEAISNCKEVENNLNCKLIITNNIVSFYSPENGKINIINLKGQSIFEGIILKNNTLSLSLGNFPRSIYILHFISDSGKTFNRKFAVN
jgi:hypothetical protein